MTFSFPDGISGGLEPAEQPRHYTCTPTGEFSIDDRAETIAWLEEHGASWPTDAVDGRRPTPMEVRSVLDSLPDAVVIYEVDDRNWFARVAVGPEGLEQLLATVQIANFSGSDQSPAEVFFPGGQPQIVLQIVARLAAVCGDMVLILNDTWPAYVSANADPSALVNKWLPRQIIVSEKYFPRSARHVEDLLAFLYDHAGDTNAEWITEREMDWYAEAYSAWSDHDTAEQVRFRFTRGFMFAFGGGTNAGIDTIVEQNLANAPGIVPVIRDAIASSHPGVRLRALIAAAWTVDPELDQIMFPVMYSEIADERNEVARYLIHRGTAEARQIARDALATEADPYVRRSLEKAAAQPDE